MLMILIIPIRPKPIIPRLPSVLELPVLEFPIRTIRHNLDMMFRARLLIRRRRRRV